MRSVFRATAAVSLLVTFGCAGASGGSDVNDSPIADAQVLYAQSYDKLMLEPAVSGIEHTIFPEVRRDYVSVGNLEGDLYTGPLVFGCPPDYMSRLCETGGSAGQRVEMCGGSRWNLVNINGCAESISGQCMYRVTDPTGARGEHIHSVTCAAN